MTYAAAAWPISWTGIAISRAGTSISAERRKAARPLTCRLSLDGDFAGAGRRSPPRCSPTRRGRGAPAAAGWGRGDAMFVDEHQRGDQLALRVEQVHLGGRRNHVGQDVADPRAQLVDELDQPLPVSSHFFTVVGGCVNRTRSSPSW